MGENDSGENIYIMHYCMYLHGRLKTGIYHAYLSIHNITI